MNYNIVILVLTIRNWYPWKKLGYFHVKTLLTFVYRKGCVIGALKPSAKCLLSKFVSRTKHLLLQIDLLVQQQTCIILVKIVPLIISTQLLHQVFFPTLRISRFVFLLYGMVYYSCTIRLIYDLLRPFLACRYI